MKRLLLILNLVTLSWIGYSQVNKYQATIDWLDSLHIKLNDPVVPIGYVKYFDCDSNVVFKNINGDTIHFYRWISVIAEPVAGFNELMVDSNYNKTIYPKSVQKNGTILVVRLDKKVFVHRNDSLFLLDMNRGFIADELIKHLMALMKNEIDSATYERRLKEAEEISAKNHPPKFKLIFHPGLFKRSKDIKLPEKVNFKGERVELIKEWEQGNRKCYQVKLHTDEAGDYKFTSDMIFLDWEGCQ